MTAHAKHQHSQYKPSPSSVYPLSPTGSHTLLKVSGNELTSQDQAVVVASSLFFVGSVFWVPAVYVWLVKRYRQIPPEQKRRRAIYASLMLATTALLVAGPHRTPRFGKFVKVHQWNLWKSWMKFFAFQVVVDNKDTLLLDNQQAILGISPHGIFPFGLAFAALTEASANVFGRFRAVVATATQLMPWVRDVLKWVNAVDASRPCVDQTLARGDRIGLAPGGIAEILQTPSPEEEYAIVGTGIFRLAVKHQVPIVPIYCFGSSMLLRRLQLGIVEKLGVWLRISLVVFFGKWGLPIPFRQRLLYVMGNPIHPPRQCNNDNNNSNNSNRMAEDMYQRYCQELVRIFDRHKESYAKGWERKSLKILPA